MGPGLMSRTLSVDVPFDPSTGRPNVLLIRTRAKPEAGPLSLQRIQHAKPSQPRRSCFFSAHLRTWTHSSATMRASQAAHKRPSLENEWSQKDGVNEHN